jgi:hypothetical protein
MEYQYMDPDGNYRSRKNEERIWALKRVFLMGRETWRQNVSQ